MSGHHHRPSLKQSNKAFKPKHASKGSIRDASKGRVPSSTSTAGPNGGRKNRTSQSVTASQSKANRRNTAKQLQAQKRAQLVNKNRLTLGKDEAKAPRIVAVIQLCPDVHNTAVVDELLSNADMSGCAITGSSSQCAVKQVEMSNPRSTLQFLTPPHGNLMASLDAVAMADFVILTLSGETEVGGWGETCLRSLASLGIGEGAIRGIVSALPENAVAATMVRKSLLSFLKHFFPSLERVQSPSVPSEASNLLRSLGDRIPRGVTWRESRPRLLAESVEWTANAEDSHNDHPEAGPSTGLGTLAITGTVRGCNISANRLVHLQGFGDFQVEKITSAGAEPEGKAKKRAVNGTMDTEMSNNIISEPTPSEADDMVSTNVPSDGEDLLAEQTWPTEDEIASAPANVHLHRAFGTEIPPPALPGTTPKRLKRVPKGTSVYQAAWIPDEDDDDDEDDFDDEDAMLEDGVEAGADQEGARLHDDDEEYENIDPDGAESQIRLAPSTSGVTSSGIGGHQDLPMDIETEQYERYLEAKREEAVSRQRENRDDLEFPDEIDTPLDIPARERFARYRGLKSFRTSTWDPYENLPRDYARCFMFQDYKTMGRKLEKRAREDGAEPGMRVTMFIKDVPQAIQAVHSPSHPLMAFGLFKHEHKYSVSNFTVTRNTEYARTIKSKDPLIVQIGCRRYNVNPLWSQHTQGNGGRGANNVHKFERFLRHGPTASVGTAYLPITFGSNVPAIVFQRSQDIRKPEESNGADGDDTAGYELVGTGSLLGVDPTRIVAKRIILTGHPYKVHKKTATIRYLFFNQPDVEYYKPVELRTKKGRTGHIRESLGTHGYFKAGFDGPIDQMDTICLTLYKRCFPKWGSVWHMQDEDGNTGSGHSQMDGHSDEIAMS